MPNDNLKHYIHLHFLVFLAGFTAIIGKAISVGAVELVWYRMAIASVLMYVYIKVFNISLFVTAKSLAKLALAGVVIALHWITFFEAINVSNASITLAMFSSGAFFASFIEPIIYKRNVIWYEIVFGVLVIVGVLIITQSEFHYIKGIILGIISAFLSSLFAVLNGHFLKAHSASKISFYEFISGVLFISFFIIFFKGGFTKAFFTLTKNDIVLLLVIASICTAYAFIASTAVMRYISPYTVVLSYNMEPIYGIVLAIVFFPESEKMSPSFYYGAAIIIGVVMLNGVFKNVKSLKRK